MARLPTTREIAEACGVSQATVSHALRDRPKIPLLTRRRVQQMARSMGWQPNPFASAYMSHLRTTRPSRYQATLGFLHTGPKSAAISDLPLHQQRHFRSAERRAAELGYRIEPFWLHEPNLTARRLRRILLSRDIPGLIIPGVIKPSPILVEFDWSPFATAMLGVTVENPLHHRVAMHYVHGYALALERLVQLGYKKIAVALSREYDRRIDHGLLYAAYYLRENPPPGVSVEIYVFERSSPTELPGIRKWLARHKPQVAIGEGSVWEAIGQMGLRVPQEIAYASADRAPEFPLIGGLDQNHDLWGGIGVELVSTALVHNERGMPAVPRCQWVEGVWRDGATVPPQESIARVRESVSFKEATPMPSLLSPLPPMAGE